MPPSRLNAGQLTIPVGNSRMTKTNLDLPDIGQMSNGSLSMVKTQLPADAMLKHGGDEYEYGNCRTVYFRMS